MLNAFSFKRKRTAWNKRKDKTMVLDTQANLPESDKAPFVTRQNGVNSSMVNLSITIKSNQFAGNKYMASGFLKKQRKKESKFLLDTLQ